MAKRNILLQSKECINNRGGRNILMHSVTWIFFKLNVITEPRLYHHWKLAFKILFTGQYVGMGISRPKILKNWHFKCSRHLTDCWSMTCRTITLNGRLLQFDLSTQPLSHQEHFHWTFIQKFQIPTLNKYLESPSLSALDYLGYLTYVHLRKESSKFSLYENLFWSRIVFLRSFFNESGLWTTKES